MSKTAKMNTYFGEIKTHYIGKAHYLRPLIEENPQGGEGR